MTTTRKPATKAPAKRAPRKRAPKPAPKPLPILTVEQQQAKVEAYYVLQAAGLPIPEDLREVKGWIDDLNAERERQAQEVVEQDAAREAQIAEANQNGPWYVRNGYPAPFNLRLDRQTEKRRIELKPRGMPGDLHPIKNEDLKDPILRQNLGLGLIEVIPAGEAAQIIEKQTTNMGHRVHTPLAILRNELGETYKQGAVKVEAEFNSQGVTVATVDPRVMQGKLHDREVGGTRGHGGISRVQPGQEVVQGGVVTDQAASVVHSAFVPTGGHPAAIQYGLDSNAHAKVVDDLARRKDTQGPSAGLGQIQVVVDPVVRT